MTTSPDFHIWIGQRPFSLLAVVVLAFVAGVMVAWLYAPMEASELAPASPLDQGGRG